MIYKQKSFDFFMSKKVLLLSLMISIFLISVVSANMDYASSANGGVVSYSIDDIGYANGVSEGSIGNVNDGNDATYFGVKAQYPDRGAWSQFSATIMFSQTVSEINQIDWIKDMRIVYGFDEAYYFCDLYVLQAGDWNHAGNCYPPGYSSPGSLTGNWQDVDGIKASLTARVGGETRFGGAYTYARLYELKAFGEEQEPPECCYDENCEDDYYSNAYCFSGDVYTNFHDFFCEDGECVEDVFSELVEDCGEEEYGEWGNYCEGNDARRQRYYAQPGCSNGACFIGTVMQDELVEECDYDCVEGECIDEPEEPECYVDSDCGINHCLGGPNYCLFNDVYQDFIVYTCNNPGQPDAYCSNNEEPWLLEECECGCENGGCLECPEPPVNVCGDDILNLGVEECDDGNLIDGDGCSAQCIIEYCGDGIINNINEECEIDCDCGQGFSCDNCMCYEDPEPPECYDDSGCNDDYYEDKYCSGGDVYRDFHDFFCEDGGCEENIITELFDKCDSDEDCEDGECVEEDDDDDDDHDSTCNDRELYNNCRLSTVEDVLVVYDNLENEVEVIDDINVIGLSQEKIIDNSWILYLFIGIGALIVLILIVLGVRG